MTHKDEWQTPPSLFKKLDDEFHFTVDVACTTENCLCQYGWYINYDCDALENWGNDEICFMNPPYSRGNIDKFAKKALEESQKGCIVVGLVRHDPSAKWYQNYVHGKAHEVRMLKRRVHFVNPETGKPEAAYNFPCCVVVWKPGIPEETEYKYLDW